MNDSPPTVLVVEDHAITRAGLSAILVHNGYSVATAPNGRVALDLLLGGLAADVILLDMLMPDVDGWHFLGNRKNTTFQAIPTIVMSGVGLSREWAAAAGCFDFLRKPFDEAELLGTLGRALKPA